MTGKLGRAWVSAWHDAWVVHGMMHGCMGACVVLVVILGDVWWGWENCMCVLPELVRLDLGVGGGLDGDGEEVVCVVSCEMEKYVDLKYPKVF